MLKVRTPTRSELQSLFPNGYNPVVTRLLLWAAFDWLIIVFCWMVMSLADHPLVYVVAAVIVAGRLHALGVILHDACHRPRIAESPPWLLLEAIAGWPIASTTAAMRFHHLRHHRASGTRTDPYWTPQLLRGRFIRSMLAFRGLALPFWWTLRAFVAPAALLITKLRNIYGRWFLQDRSGLDLSASPEVLACARADLRQALAHSGVAFLVVSQGLPFSWYYLVPWMLAGLLNARRVVAEHDADEVTTASRENMAASARTNKSGWLLDSILYPHHIGYHEAHHRVPTASFVHLRQLHSALSTKTDFLTN